MIFSIKWKCRLSGKSTICQLLGVMIRTTLVFTDSDEKNTCQSEDWKSKGAECGGWRMTRNERELSPENSETFRVAELLSFLQPLGETSLLTPFQALNYSWIFIFFKINLFLWVFAAVTIMSLCWDLGVTVISVQMEFSHTTTTTKRP